MSYLSILCKVVFRVVVSESACILHKMCIRDRIIGDAKADYREPGITDGNSHGNTPRNQGRILTGNEYLTVFNGLTGEAMKTIDYVPARGKLTDWGDNRANRSDRFLACVAYLDGVHPSLFAPAPKRRKTLYL